MTKKRFLSLIVIFCMGAAFIQYPVSANGAAHLGLLWPVKGYYGVDSGFGYRSGTGSFHGGIDIFRPQNTEIYAAQDGVVERAEYHSSWGNHVKIRHDNTYHTLYAHMTRYIVSPGDYVKQGQLIGYVGMTGNAYGYHLHFEIYENGTRINPVPVNVDGRHSYSGSAPLNQEVYYVYDINSYEDPTPPEPPAPVHTHSWETLTESAHPHRQYRYCSGCDTKEYTGKNVLKDSCNKCYPLGNVNLTRSFNRTSGDTTFYRNNVENANNYSLVIYRRSYSGGNYSQYGSKINMQSKSYFTSLPQGYYYYGELTIKNTNTNQTKTVSCDTFRIYNTYTVKYNANGGTGVPSNQTKIQDESLTLSSQRPTKAHYIFKGWASSKTATSPQYAPGDKFTKNTNITLYAVWEPETYTVTFDANGGKGELSDASVTYGNTIKMPNTVVKDYCYLKGWATSRTATTVEYKLGLEHAIDKDLTLYAVWGQSTWNNEISSSLSGSGSEADPYLISSAADLAYLAHKVNSAEAAPIFEYYKMTDNINLVYSEWVPIGVGGNDNQYFYGSFDGNGYTISDLYITSANEGNIGLFGCVKNSTIKDLTVTGAIESITMTDKANIGGIIGTAVNSELNRLSVMYFNIGSISVGTSGFSAMGAAFGNVDGGSITGCSANECHIDLKAGRYNTGMIAGYTNTVIEDCSVNSSEVGLFSSTADIEGFRMGGLCGFLNAPGKAKKCSVYAPYLSNNLKTTNGGVATMIGGLCGFLTGDAEVCTAKFGGASANTITSSGAGTAAVGGLVGQKGTDARIVDCKFDGASISAQTSGTAYVGGLVGYAQAKEISTVLTAPGGQSLNKSSLPKKDGYTATWYTDSELTTPYDFSQNVTADTTLYAKWEEGEDQPEIWDGTTQEPQYDASTKTYNITNGRELAWISDISNGIITTGNNMPVNSNFSGYTIKLEQDIYLNDTSDWENWNGTNRPANNWNPISQDKTNGFKGTFDGTNHVIRGIFIYYYGTMPLATGLFAYLKDGTIKNVGIEHSYIYGSSYGSGHYTAGIVAVNSEGTVLNCHNNGYVYGQNAGGVVGKNYGIIQNCHNACRIEAYYSSGGISGLNGGIVENCYNTGKIISDRGAGGISSDNSGMDSKIRNCHNIGEVFGEFCSAGIVAYNSGATVEYCYNIGSITKGTSSSYSDMGGITASNAGYPTGSKVDSPIAYSYVKYCYSTQSPLGRTGSYSSTTSVSQKTATQMRSLSNLSGFSNSYWATNSNINNGYPYIKALEETYKTYTITAVADGISDSVSRSFANISGGLSGNAGTRAVVGGAIGYGTGNAGAFSNVSNMIAIANSVTSQTSGNTNAYSGSIIGMNNGSKFGFNNAYYNSEMNVESSGNNIDTTGIARSSRTINVSFLTNILGLKQYTSLADLDTDESTVWILKNGELPELYYNVLNDITVSDKIENGTITPDRLQAVDGEIVTVLAEAAEGYQLNRIYVNGEEITGDSFEVSGASEIYATFTEETPEYTVTVSNDENAAATLVNSDKEPEVITLMAMPANNAGAGDDTLIAFDGDEITVDAFANEGYTVDYVCVNGEEIAGTSFIVDKDSIVTLEISDLSTNIYAVTNDPDVVGAYFATLSGSVIDDGENVERYIRYWSEADPETVYTTEVMSGAGTYTVDIMPLEPLTKYYYQMTDDGEIKSFTTIAYYEDITNMETGDEPDYNSIPITETTYKALTSSYKFTVVCDEAQDQGIIAVALYDEEDKLLDLKMTEADGDDTYTLSTSKNTAAAYAKVFVWDSLDGMTPVGGAEKVSIK